MEKENPRNMIQVCRGCMEKNKGTFDIEIGDYAKIRFGDASPGEYMWIKVTKVNGNKLEGTLDNDPVIVKDVKFGDTVTFLKENVCERIRD